VTALRHARPVSSTTPRVGALIVRVWMENEDPAFLRARIVHTTEVSSEKRHACSAATPEAIYATVREWLEAFIRDARRN
jgi:hypothetical protein